ncbi:phosphate regulon sensor protein PhoR [Catenovulum agarivorans DS-2]|uniref:Phosphate regulon sensor protein PhoR n=1 Tax=Catenovulum agarivorans DS-2 TaxID=1328313 RepID=W7Q9P2_9ALTE|nr:phosphate regulon sensor histidine kinase PhoR [Catenovulum agarivorans]EWH09549.1 phosphate regulon sensor protein PhoR [Catenovulum agarivorans DS-2]
MIQEQYIRAISRFILLLSVAVLIGYLIDEIAVCVVLLLLSLLVWYTYNLNRLNDWLTSKKNLYPPSSNGLWSEIFDGIYRLQRKNRQRRKELGQVLKRFRDGAEALPDAAVVVEDTGQIIWCNKLALFVFGLKWPEDSGLLITNLIRYPAFIEHFGQHAKDKESTGDYILIPSPVERDSIIEIRMVPYALGQVLILGRDVTQTQRLNQMRKDFIANVSHELRTPLTVLQGYLEMMQDPDMAQAVPNTKAVGMMSEQCERMFSLVNQLLVLSRIEANQENIYDHIVDVPAIMLVIEKEAEQLNVQVNHTIRFDIDHDLLMHGIEDELRSAFTNLVKNAIRYTPAGGIIDVKWFKRSGCAVFSVTDDGDGIEPQHLSRLTERFYRVDKARSRTTGGSGLGLSIVKHVLAHHNSQLEIQSKVDEGSCFSFSFPSELVVARQRRARKSQQIA